MFVSVSRAFLGQFQNFNLQLVEHVKTILTSVHIAQTERKKSLTNADLVEIGQNLTRKKAVSKIAPACGSIGLEGKETTVFLFFGKKTIEGVEQTPKKGIKSLTIDEFSKVQRAKVEIFLQ